MFPVVHLAVGYGCYAIVSRRRDGRPPAEAPALAALAGAALPDLLDKPLAAAGVVPVGRTIGHSLLFALPVAVAVWVLARDRGRPRLGLAFAVGIGSHLAADVPWHVLAGDFEELGSLLWPVTPMPEYTGRKVLATVGDVEILSYHLEAVVLIAVAALWWRDGRPGLEPIRAAIGR